MATSDVLTPPDWRTIDIDYDNMVAKYREERDKRTQKRGIGQYHHAHNSPLQPMTDDPFVEPGFKRDPVEVEHDIVIAGGGVGGLVMASRLVKAGFKNILIIEKGGNFGGVWYWNRYPGIQIDIESYIYLPLLEDLGYTPKRKYAYGQEISDYLRSVGKHFGLYEKALFQTEVSEMRWDEDTLRWTVTTSHGDKISAKWIVPATGPFDNPKFPGIPGIENFKGHQFHSSRWDYRYTGGDTEGNLTELKDKRVGIIGTGATGIQIIPHLGKWSKELYVFQRTPSSIDIRMNRLTDTKWYESQAPGWQRVRMDNFAALCSGITVDEDLVNDGWTASLQHLTGWFGQSKTGHQQVEVINTEETAKLLQLADFKKMESIRRRVDQIVKDPTTADALKPYFNQFCKRPCFHDEYLSTYNRPSVTLVDTLGQGVQAITEDGIRANGKEYKLDCIIYATGFEYNSDWKVRHHADIIGTNGLSLTEKWKDGPVTLHGWAVHGFPNCFFVSSAQTAGIPNYQHSLDDQATHLVHIMSNVKDNGIARFEVNPKAEAEWVEHVVKVGKDRAEYLATCTPGYYNDEGQVTAKTIQNNPYGGGVSTFLDIVRNWRETGTMEGIDFVRKDE
ncbi:phenylacetone monooxygenase [Ilyonectria sp. MPI-CAGE-AT-0026]|nr:phenylacetone monooxygenase [Ilyonectria sp. MPI-CAGE-AT-0026]